MFHEDQLTRHRELITDNALSTPITVIGAGAIGSFTVLSLAKMGFNNIAVYDFDTVEVENLGAQFFATNCVGMPKVEALKKMVMDFTGIEITAVNEKILPTRNPTFTNIVISALDNMEARAMIPDLFISKYIIDPRMGAEYATLNVTATDSASMEKYFKTLYSDSEAVHERCTAKTTIYTVLLISGQVVKAVKDITMGKPFIKTLDWSIRDNSLVAFSSEGQKL